MGIGWPQLLIIALVVLVLFGRGRIAEMMGDFGKGISSFKKGMTEEEAEKPASKAQIEAPAQDAAAAPVATPDPVPAPSAADKKAAETTDGSN